MRRAASRLVAGRNRLLAALPPAERERLLLHCRPVVLPHERVLLAPREQVRYAYFPTDGVVSLLMVIEDGTPVEVATVGSEGFVSVESILSTDQSPYEVVCQTAVEALRADELSLTHDTLARMLGVHRPTISHAAEALRDRGLIAYHRGRITITDRQGLLAASCEHYAEFRAVYEDLVGPAPTAA